jgi:ArsR family transcriptional regulator
VVPGKARRSFGRHRFASATISGGNRDRSAVNCALGLGSRAVTSGPYLQVSVERNEAYKTLKVFDTEVTVPSMTKTTASATAGYAKLFRALGDATRLEMVGLLAASKKELCVCELEAHFDLGQPTVSHHLRILREAGIVSSERRGTWVYYALERGVRQKLRGFEELLDQ